MNRKGWALCFAAALAIDLALWLVPGFRGWFIESPVDVIFAFGNIGFAVGGIKNLANKRTRVDRIHSLNTAVTLTCFIVAFWQGDNYVTILMVLPGIVCWWGLFFFRYIGRPLPPEYLKGA